MRKNILVSIIVPVYNNEKYLEECILSLVNQTYKNIEIILINDGSSDNSYTLMKLFQKKYKNIRAYTQQNKGASAARYKGITKSTGEYVMFVDADDWIELDTVENLVKKIEKKPYDTIRYLGIMEPSKIIKNQYDFQMKRQKVLSKKEIYNLLIETKCLNSLCFGIYNRNLLDNIESFTKKISNCEDYWANLDIYTKANNTLMLNEVLYHYRENMDSTTKTLKLERIEKNIQELIFVYSKLFYYLRLWNIDTEENKVKVSFTILEAIRSSIFMMFKVENMDRFSRKQFIEKVLEEEIFNEIRKKISYKQLRDYLNTKSFKYKLKNSQNIKNMYKGRKTALYLNYYLVLLRKIVKEG